MRIVPVLYFLFLAAPFSCFSQVENTSGTSSVDSLYREDQFYLGFTYNLLRDMPETVSPSGFSGGFHAGFVRDFPVNEKRDLAIGVGLGWSVNSYAQTLFIGEETSEETIFMSLEGLDIRYDTNRFTTYSVEMPLQFRWRTSTFSSHKFWRVYTGLQLGYVYQFQSRFEQSGNRVRQTDVPEFDRFRLGATFAFGYNTFNFHVYYGLNPFLKKEAQLDGQEIGMNTVRVGLMFFIL